MSESKDQPIKLRCPKHAAEEEIGSEEDLDCFTKQHRWCGQLETYQGDQLTETFKNWTN